MREQGHPNSPITAQKAFWGQWASGGFCPPFSLSLCHGRLPLEGGDLLFCHELLHSLDRPRLMLLQWVGIPQDYLNLGTAQERRQRHKVNARLCRPLRKQRVAHPADASIAGSIRPTPHPGESSPAGRRSAACDTTCVRKPSLPVDTEDRKPRVHKR